MQSGERGAAEGAVGLAVVEGLHMAAWATGGPRRAALETPQEVVVAQCKMCVCTCIYMHI